MNDQDFAFLVTVLQKQNDILMMLLREANPEAAATVDHVHNNLHMYMWEDWEVIDAAQEELRKNQ